MKTNSSGFLLSASKALRRPCLHRRRDIHDSWSENLTPFSRPTLEAFSMAFPAGARTSTVRFILRLDSPSLGLLDVGQQQSSGRVPQHIDENTANYENTSVSLKLCVSNLETYSVWCLLPSPQSSFQEHRCSSRKKRCMTLRCHRTRATDSLRISTSGGSTYAECGNSYRTR